jgi:DNA-binding SARP family transcriptional activator/tetratricopeptide (TPR) repeat protein/putative sterol carrier protein
VAYGGQVLERDAKPPDLSFEAQTWGGSGVTQLGKTEGLEFRILGPVEVLSSGRPVRFSRSREWALLALLLLHPNRVVSADRLVDELWDGYPPEQAGVALRGHVSRLRKVLGAELIVTRPPGYELQVDVERIDASRFERLSAAAHGLLAIGNFPEAALGFRDSLALWRGPALADMADLSFARSEIVRLEELRLTALEGRIEADLACGRHAQLVAELDSLAQGHPLRERLWASRILALYRSGRQVEALRAFQEVRGALAEVGVEPGPELVGLERSIVQQAPELNWYAADGAASTTTHHLDSSSTAGIVTLAFSDPLDSSELLDRLGEDRADALRRKYLGVLRRAVAAHGGNEVKGVPDGLIVAFTSASDAVACAVETQQAIARHNRRHPDASMEVRIGLHAGEPIRDEADYFGTPVVVAKRLCDQAKGGQILASRLIASLVGSGGGFSFQTVGPFSLKDLAERVVGCEVTWAERPAVRFPLPPAVADESAPFVGRRDELARTQRMWEKAETGERQVLLVTGEPGIGKTALVNQAARTAHAAGALVLFGHCDEESLIPFQPFVEALGHYASLCPIDELRSEASGVASDVAMLVPELRRRLPDLAGSSDPGADAERYRLFEAVPAFLGAIAEQEPVVLILDDLHWADRPTLQLLLHTVRRTPGTPLLILGTYRDTDLVRTHPMAEALVELRRANLTERIPLRGLAADDVIALVAGGDAADAEDRALGEAVWAESEGNPLFVREILRHLTETGAVVHEANGRYRSRRQLEQLGIPEGVKEVIGRRLTRLSDEVNTVLRTASVMGREFRADVVGWVNDTPPTAVLDSLDEAAAAGVVAEVPGVVGSYAFTHALVRETLYGELSLTRRVLLHQRVGEAVEALHADDLGPYLAELAHHFTNSAAAGQADKAIDYATRAGERAMRQVAYEEAARQFAMALEVAQDLGASQERRVDLLLALGAAEWRAKNTDVARATFERAAEGARRLGDPRRLARAALGYVGAEVRWIWLAGLDPNRRAVELLEEALGALGDSDTGLRARVMGSLAQELALEPEARERREQLSAEAVAIARRSDDPATLGWVLCARTGTTFDDPDTIDERLANAAEALRLAEALGNPNLAALAQQHCFPALLQRNDLAAARAALERASEMATAIRDPVLVEVNLHHEGLLATLEGRFDEAQARHEHAFRIGQDAHDFSAFALMGAAITTLMWLRGRIEEILGGSEQAAASSDLAFMRVVAAAHRATLEHDAECREWVGSLEVGDLGPPFFPFDAFELGWACAFLGDRDRSRALYSLLLPYAEQNAEIGGVACAGSVSVQLGTLAAALGRHTDAYGHFEHAIASARANGWAPVVADTQVKLAAALLAEGGARNTERAIEVVEDALQTGRRLDMRDVVRRSKQLLEQARGRNPRTSRRPRARVTRRDLARARVASGGRRAAARLLKGSSEEDLARRFGSPGALRALFAAMARSFQPAMASGLAGDIVFELSHQEADVEAAPSTWWTIELREAKASARPGASDGALATIHTDVASFVHLALGDLDLTMAALYGRLRVDGDFVSVMRLGTLFGGVAPFEVPEGEG